MMQVRPIKSEDDLEAALVRTEELLEEGARSDELDILLVLVEHYERQHHSIPPGDPLEVIRFKLRELNISQNEAARLAGMSSGRLSEILTGKRDLTLTMVRSIGQALGVPLGALVGSPASGSVFVEIPAELAARVRATAMPQGVSFAEWVAGCLRRGCAAGSDTITAQGPGTVAPRLADQLGHRAADSWAWAADLLSSVPDGRDTLAA